MRNYIGADIIEIERIRQAMARWNGRFLRRVYTAAELELCGGRASSLAARFAGKEAIMKLLGARGMSWQDIEILADPDGRPTVCLRGEARRRAEAQNIRDIDISLSHSREYAMAAAVGSA